MSIKRIPKSAWDLSTGLNPGGRYVVASLHTDRGEVHGDPVNVDSDSKRDFGRAVTEAKESCLDRMQKLSATWAGTLPT